MVIKEAVNRIMKRLNYIPFVQLDEIKELKDSCKVTIDDNNYNDESIFNFIDSACNKMLDKYCSYFKVKKRTLI